MGLLGRISTEGPTLEPFARKRYPGIAVGRVDCPHHLFMRGGVSVECCDDAADGIAARADCRLEGVWLHKLSDRVALHEVCAGDHDVWRASWNFWRDVA